MIKPWMVISWMVILSHTESFWCELDQHTLQFSENWLGSNSRPRFFALAPRIPWKILWGHDRPAFLLGLFNLCLGFLGFSLGIKVALKFDQSPTQYIWLPPNPLKGIIIFPFRWHFWGFSGVPFWYHFSAKKGERDELCLPCGFTWGFGEFEVTDDINELVLWVDGSTGLVLLPGRKTPETPETRSSAASGLWGHWDTLW